MERSLNRKWKTVFFNGMDLPYQTKIIKKRHFAWRTSQLALKLWLFLISSSKITRKLINPQNKHDLLRWHISRMCYSMMFLTHNDKSIDSKRTLILSLSCQTDFTSFNTIKADLHSDDHLHSTSLMIKKRNIVFSTVGTIILENTI